MGGAPGSSATGAESQVDKEMEVRAKGGDDSEMKEEDMEVRQRGEEAPPSVLLQVSEAHLALFPDEDGDT